MFVHPGLFYAVGFVSLQRQRLRAGADEEGNDVDGRVGRDPLAALEGLAGGNLAPGVALGQVNLAGGRAGSVDGRNEDVRVNVLEKLCTSLDCKLNDIVEFEAEQKK